MHPQFGRDGRGCDKWGMKLTRTPLFLDLDRPRQIIFNMHVRKQLEELQDAGELNISEIFQERDGKRFLNWKYAMLFVTAALREDALAHGERLEVQDVERQIGSVPEAVEILSLVFGEYGKFLGVAPGEAGPVAAKESARAAAGDEKPKAGHAKRLIASSADSTASAPASSGD